MTDTLIAKDCTIKDEQVTEITPVSWKSFTLEEHLSGFVGRRNGEIIQVKKTWKGRYRVNLISMQDRKIRSAFVKVIESPEGYILERVDAVIIRRPVGESR